MRSLLLGAFLISASPAFAQWNFGHMVFAPVPSDPLELVTGTTQIPATAAARADVVTLMNHAAQNHALHSRGGAPYNLQVSFNASASTLYPQGQGSLQETWVSGENWRWTTTLGNYSQIQTDSSGAIYGEIKNVMPMRVRTLRQVLFVPVMNMQLGSRSTIRTATVTYNGKPVTCVLTSGSGNDQVPAQGRQWYENEYCIDPTNSTVQIFSPAPGIYAAFDYASPLKFHGHVLPDRITVTEKGQTVLQANLTSITDADPSNLAIFAPTGQMVAQGPGTVMDGLERFPMPVMDASVPQGVVQPTIVHATFAPNGHIEEVETLQSGPFADRALAMVANFQLPPAAQPSGAPSRQREAFINVQFRPR
jgi:hypothetical protein